MQTEIEQWGNTLAIRIPDDVAKRSSVHKGTLVDVTVEEGRIVATPIKNRKYSLEELVAKITDENRHEEVDFGPPVGKEIW